MILLVDIGNSQIKWTVIEAKALAESQYFARPKTAIKTALTKAWKTLENVKAVYVSNVAGENRHSTDGMGRKKWQLKPVFVQSEKDVSVSQMPTKNLKHLASIAG